MTEYSDITPVEHEAFRGVISACADVQRLQDVCIGLHAEYCLHVCGGTGERHTSRCRTFLVEMRRATEIKRPDVDAVLRSMHKALDARAPREPKPGKPQAEEGASK